MTSPPSCSSHGTQARLPGVHPPPLRRREVIVSHLWCIDSGFTFPGRMPLLVLLTVTLIAGRHSRADRAIHFKGAWGIPPVAHCTSLRSSRSRWTTETPNGDSTSSRDLAGSCTELMALLNPAPSCRARIACNCRLCPSSRDRSCISWPSPRSWRCFDPGIFAAIPRAREPLPPLVSDVSA